MSVKASLKAPGNLQQAHLRNDSFGSVKISTDICKF